MHTSTILECYANNVAVVNVKQNKPFKTSSTGVINLRTLDPLDTSELSTVLSVAVHTHKWQQWA